MNTNIYNSTNENQPYCTSQKLETQLFIGELKPFIHYFLELMITNINFSSIPLSLYTGPFPDNCRMLSSRLLVLFRILTIKLHPLPQRHV